MEAQRPNRLIQNTTRNSAGYDKQTKKYLSPFPEDSKLSSKDRSPFSGRKGYYNNMC